ncbi:MAG: T9SS type A sorting domain-containing protein [Bacteroidota bacterium]
MCFLGLAGLEEIIIHAQFAGGSGDGVDQVSTVQVDLSGVPVGVRPLYGGGSGDGFDKNLRQAFIDGQSSAAIYSGGSDDGFDRSLKSFTLSGQDLAPLYVGGPGDGFDRVTDAFTLNGTSLDVLYAGGSGDGFDRLVWTSTIDGTSITGLYSGGVGDGFDRSTFIGGLMGEMFMLYGGGEGDGFDRSRVSYTLSGTDLAHLYGGGDGDGFDVNRFEGVVPLPLTLISFSALPQVEDPLTGEVGDPRPGGIDFVLVSWVTEDEVDTDFFTIEKTRDGRDFTWVGEREAAGFSEPGERLHYDLKDYDPYLGTSFYRLKTTDFDGAISLSHLVEVNYAASSDDWDFVLFPNPNTGKHFSIDPEGLQPERSCLIELVDAQGRLLFQQILSAEDIDGQRFELTEPLPGGSYLIRLSDDRGESKAKILLVGGR